MALRSIGFLVSGRLDTPTGGYRYDRHMIEGLRARGWLVDLRELDASFPFPSAAALDDARRALASFADGTVVMIDSLALGALPDAVERESTRLQIVGLVHLPLSADVARDSSAAAQLLLGERRALAAAAFVIVTGAAAVPLLAPLGVARTKIAIVEPGTEAAAPASGSGDSETLHFVSVATLNSGKGHEILLRAFEPLQARAWRLTCVGSTTREPQTAARLRAQLGDLGIRDRVSLVGELDDAGVASAYDGADVFVTATLRETYGMAVAEALARGLPVIGTHTGAIAELVGEDAGIVVPPGDAGALSAALARIIEEPGLRARLTAGALRVRDRLPTWEQAIGRMEAALSQFTNQ
jgi:glycosyltransferase involved in cell wall biosynthesis